MDTSGLTVTHTISITATFIDIATMMSVTSNWLMGIQTRLIQHTTATLVQLDMIFVPIFGISLTISKALTDTSVLRDLIVSMIIGTTEMFSMET